MPQFLTNKQDIKQTKLLPGAAGKADLTEGQIRVKVDRFGYSANNITYAAVGHQLGYWQFFPPEQEDGDIWGLVPVWGFADVVQSNAQDIKTGERLFGYFPPADYLIMTPSHVGVAHFVDASAHRSALPSGYNLYRRVNFEPGYSKQTDDHRMLLYPLYLTSFSLWDHLKSEDWFGAERIILLSASSKTSIGLAQALHDDAAAPQTNGITSPSNEEFVKGLSLYTEVLTYEQMSDLDASVPTVIVDMAGNSTVAGVLHKHLGENMLRSINVGLTHWDVERGNDDINRDRSHMYFAPSQIQQRIKEWGSEAFEKKSSAFVMDAINKSANWLSFKRLNGLEELASIYNDVCDGKNPPNEGLTIEM